MKTSFTFLKTPRNSLSTASVDVRERNDGYAIRVHLPGRDLAKVEVVFAEGKALRIMAPADGKAGRYEQTILLEGVTPGAEPRIERKPNVHLIVVELPKQQPSGEAPPASATPPPPVLLPTTDPWDRQILEQMERMRHEMDRMFDQAFEDLEDLPDPKDFFDRARFGASVDPAGLKTERKQGMLVITLPKVKQG